MGLILLEEWQTICCSMIPDQTLRSVALGMCLRLGLGLSVQLLTVNTGLFMRLI